MEIKAQAKFVRMSARKVRLVIDLIRGKSAEEAATELDFMAKAAAKGPVLKLLKSAIANAVNNLKLKKENLYIKKITVDEGPVLKRWQPRAFGRATPIRKGSSHITIILAEKVVTKKAAKTEEKEKLEKPKVVEALKVFTREQAKEDVKAAEKKPEKDERAKKEIKRSKGFLRKIFSRKTG